MISNYGAKADNATDVGPAIKSAFSNCVVKNPNSRLIVPKVSCWFQSTESRKLKSKIGKLSFI
jgi:polygalacturonase